MPVAAIVAAVVTHPVAELRTLPGTGVLPVSYGLVGPPAVVARAPQVAPGADARVMVPGVESRVAERQVDADGAARGAVATMVTSQRGTGGEQQGEGKQYGGLHGGSPDEVTPAGCPLPA